MQEQIKIEVMSDPDSAVQNRVRGTPRIKSQSGRNMHPNTRYSISQPFAEQCAKFEAFATKHIYPEVEPRCHTPFLSPCGKSNVLFGKAGEGHHMIIPDLPNNECERNDYNASHCLSTPRMDTGFTDARRQITREKLPTGRPSEAPNLVKTRMANGGSIDPIKAADSHNLLAHVPN